MAPFITGTQTPNPRSSISLTFNRIPQKKTARKPSTLASDQTDRSTSTKKVTSFKKA